MAGCGLSNPNSPDTTMLEKLCRSPNRFSVSLTTAVMRIVGDDTKADAFCELRNDLAPRRQ